MRTVQAVVACLALLIVANTAKAANTASWDNGYPSAGTGKVTGQGTYVEANGWTVLSVAMFALPNGGGLSSTAVGAAPANGKWGPITIMNLTAGQYTVYATVTFKDGNGNRQQINTPTAVVNVS